MKTLLFHYKLLSEGSVDRSLLPRGHEAQLHQLLSDLVGAPRLPAAPLSSQAGLARLRWCGCRLHSAAQHRHSAA